ncbi:MAG: cytochrome c oxidase subunit II [Chloroflexota bacterium]|nr:cytochrome c oxidase subunit II [Chloroflexota bacterium]
MPLPRASGVACRLLIGVSLLSLMLLASACANVPQSSVLPKTEAAREIHWLYELIFWLAVIVFVGVQGALLYIMWRYRYREGHALPDQVHGNTALEIGWTIAPAVVLVIMAVPTIRTIFALETPATTSPGGGAPLIVDVIGKQWWWEYRYPEFQDAQGRPLTTANEMVLPVGRTAVLRMTSDNVIHSWWVPQLMGKMDVMPTHITEIWFTPEEPGQYFGQCAEYCGIQHAMMRTNVIAMTPTDFQAWVTRQMLPAQPIAEVTPDTAALIAAGAEAFQLNGCIGCHTIQAAIPEEGKIGPNLSHFGSRTTLAAGVMQNTHENLAHWLENPQAIKPGNFMPNLLLRPQDIEALVAYLHSLK